MRWALYYRTNQLWQLKPIIDGEFWTGPDWFVVEPQQSKAYELVYYPLTMTTDGRKHQVRAHFHTAGYALFKGRPKQRNIAIIPRVYNLTT